MGHVRAKFDELLSTANGRVFSQYSSGINFEGPGNNIGPHLSSNSIENVEQRRFVRYLRLQYSKIDKV
jgi:hypothetical protein